MQEAKIRTAQLSDLAAINAVIKDAVMGWNLPERVKRLSVGSFTYDELDYSHLQMWVAELDQQIIGVAALETDADMGIPLLHGLFVRPDVQHQSIGRQLLFAVEQTLVEDGILQLRVKAQKDAVGFFLKQGFTIDPCADHSSYANLLNKKLH